ncbi:MAG: four helix bundle protein [Vicinamibacteria bacterium]
MGAAIVSSAQTERPEPSAPAVPDAPAVLALAAPAAPATAAPTDEASEPQLDASKLHVYNVAIELHVHCSTLVAMLNRVLKDQLERSSLSVVLNCAEAGGRRSRRDKSRFFSYARGSATETAAILDVLERRRLASPAAVRTGRRLAIRIVQMLTKIDQSLKREAP